MDTGGRRQILTLRSWNTFLHPGARVLFFCLPGRLCVEYHELGLGDREPAFVSEGGSFRLLELELENCDELENF